MTNKATSNIEVGDRLTFEVEGYKQTGIVERIDENLYTVREADNKLYQWDRVREDPNGWGITDDTMYKVEKQVRCRECGIEDGHSRMCSSGDILTARETESDRAAWSRQDN